MPCDLEPAFGRLRPGRTTRALLGAVGRLPPHWPTRLCTSLVRQLTSRGMQDAVDIQVFGFRARVHPGDNLCEKRLLFTPQFFDREERLFLRERARPGYVFVDVGANVGAYSLVVAQLCGDDCRILAVEPDPMLFQRLEFNTRANDYKSITLAPVAISDDTADADLFLNAHNRGQNSLVGDAESSVRVHCMPLLDLLNAHDIGQPDCLKIDVEGAEERILSRFFADAPADRWPRSVVLEQYRDQPLSPAAERLHSRGYRLRLRTRMNVILEL